jgi:hypothetical protein
MKSVSRTLAGLLVAMVLGVHPVAAQSNGAETFDEQLERAENAWVFGDFDEVIQILRDRMLPDRPEGSDRQVERGYTRLGASALYLDDSALAEAAFLALLRGDPSYELDPFLFPNTVIDFFEAVREEHRDELVRLSPMAQAGEVVWVERHVREQSLAVSMLPFGAGFFASERTVEGGLWLGAQSGLAATSLTFWLINENSRIQGGSLVGPQGGLLRSDTTVRRQRVHVATGALFFGAVVANALHGALTHERTRQIDFRTLPGPPEELSRAPRPARGWRVSFVPLVELGATHFR